MRRSVVLFAVGLGLLTGWGRSLAHDFRAGDIVIDHPYAVPSLPGSPHGMLHLRALKNTGRQPDTLLEIRSPVASAVEIHQMNLGDDQVMRMRPLPALELPAGAEIKLMHGGAYHLMLMNLKAPLKAGDRFPVTLRFARAGSQEVMVSVQQPRDKGGAAPPHAH